MREVYHYQGDPGDEDDLGGVYVNGKATLPKSDSKIEQTIMFVLNKPTTNLSSGPGKLNFAAELGQAIGQIMLDMVAEVEHKIGKCQRLKVLEQAIKEFMGAE